VTEADLAVNTYLADRLRKFRPEYGWLSEETADQPSERRKTRTWVVDPIDGTRAFMRGEPHWCIGLAVVEEGISVAAVLYAPVFDELFEARLSGGAYLNGIAMRTSERSAEAGWRLIVNQTLIDHPDWPAPWPEVVVSDPKPNATLYRLALVASGAWDATFVLFRKSDWDLAAGALLVEEAGGRVTTHIGEALQFNKAVPAQRSLLAAGKALHPLLMRRMNRLELPDTNAS